MDCTCAVCQALVGLCPEDATVEIIQQLPEAVQHILAAQDRVRLLRPRPGDEELVQEAARRCRGGRFPRPLPRHH